MSSTSDVVITVQPREELGKEETGRLRRSGKIPAIVYGGDRGPVPITVDRDSLYEILKGESGENTIFLLKLEGTDQERRAMIKDIQVHPITRDFVHLDFIRVTTGHKLNVTVPIELEGDCLGVRQGGRVNFISRELGVEVLPREMVNRFVIDISEMDIGDAVKVSDLEERLPESGRFLEDADRVVVLIEAPRVVLEEEEELEEEAEALVEEQAEPEVLRGRGGDEESE
jgi:large subunit ribosomal protein L25